MRLISYSQNTSDLIYKYHSRWDSTHYSKTDFSQVDTLDKWCYSININSKPSKFDSAKPLCLVSFTRFVPLCDSAGYYKFIKGLNLDSTKDGIYLHQGLKEQILYNPTITFNVYPIQDSSAAYKISEINMRITSSLPPRAGGDLFIIGAFIFVHDDLSVRCGSLFSGKEDYLRPLLNFIFKDLKNTNAITVMDLLKRLPIKQCNLR